MQVLKIIMLGILVGFAVPVMGSLTLTTSSAILGFVLNVEIRFQFLVSFYLLGALIGFLTVVMLIESK